MKKVLVDLYKAKNEFSGLGQFSIRFAEYISEHYGHEFEFHFLVPRNHEFKLTPLVKLIKVNPLLKFFTNSHEQYDLWHSLHQYYSYRPPSAVKQLLTLHDLNFLIEKKEIKQKKYLKRLEKEIRRADHVVAISKFTNTQLKKTLSNIEVSSEVIYNGMDYLVNTEPTRPKVQVGDHFFFSISIFSEKKNFEVLLPMMKYFPDYKLILAGNHDSPYGTLIKQKIRELGLEEQVILPGVIPDSEKVYYLKLCDAFLFPSLAEGFGMPPIEAMQFGKLVFLSDQTSLPEIGGNVVQYFSDYDPEKMAIHIKYSLIEYESNKHVNINKIKAQADRFTWKECADRYVRIYRELIA